jgi:hypothetical protein
MINYLLPSPLVNIVGVGSGLGLGLIGSYSILTIYVISLVAMSVISRASIVINPATFLPTRQIKYKAILEYQLENI